MCRRGFFRRSAARSNSTFYPRLTPWALFLRRFAASDSGSFSFQISDVSVTSSSLPFQTLDVSVADTGLRSVIRRGARSWDLTRERGGLGSTWPGGPAMPWRRQLRPILPDREELPDTRLERAHGLREVRGAILQRNRTSTI